jgi:hypothetical protein
VGRLPQQNLTLSPACMQRYAVSRYGPADGR